MLYSIFFLYKAKGHVIEIPYKPNISFSCQFKSQSNCMASYTQPASKMPQLIKSDRRMFSASDDSAMVKQIQATHAPDGREVDVKPILHVIEDILHRATPTMVGVLKVLLFPFFSRLTW